MIKKSLFDTEVTGKLLFRLLRSDKKSGDYAQTFIDENDYVELNYETKMV